MALEKEGKGKAMRMPCRGWRCTVCIRRLRFYRGLHLADILLARAKPVHVATVAVEKGPAAGKRINDANGNFVRARELVLSTIPLKTSTAFEPGEAVRLLGSTLPTLRVDEARDK